MFNRILRPLIFLLLVCMFPTCVDPYIPILDDFQSILVVDALLTNENKAYTVELSKTKQAQNTESEKVSGAQVLIKEENNNTVLAEISPGIYKTDSLEFMGQSGNTYTLYIKTSEGDEYESEPCFMYPVQSIDSIYFKKDVEILNNGSEILEGIRILIDSKATLTNNYFRWIYDEWWKISVSSPKRYIYINDSLFEEVDEIKQNCWGHYSSDEILTHSNESHHNEGIKNKPIHFISPGKTEKLLIRYCFQIKQLSISKEEYQFWELMQQISESGGDIFDKQPFPIVSNIHNINDPDEQVLGYFQVSSVDFKQIYITPDVILDLGIENYRYDCETLTLSPNDFPPALFPGGGMTFRRIYNTYNNSTYSFTEPIFNELGNLSKMVFSKTICTDCTIYGSLKRPEFWED